MKFSTEPSRLAAALKAVREFTSDDPTRLALQLVYAESNGTKLRLTATDGHTLCSVETEVAWEGIAPTAGVLLDNLAIDTLAAQCKVSKGLSVAPFELKNTSELAFPDYRRVAPEKAADDAKHKTASVCQRFNGDYLARIGHVQKALKSKNGARLQFSNGNSGEPLRADIVGAMGEATVIIMGMRL